MNSANKRSANGRKTTVEVASGVYGGKRQRKGDAVEITKQGETGEEKREKEIQEERGRGGKRELRGEGWLNKRLSVGEGRKGSREPAQ